MPYLIATYDKPGMKAVRDQGRAGHIAHMEANLHRVIAGGGFITDDAGEVIGGLIILDVDSREEVDAFIAADPFTALDLFERVDVVRWRPVFFAFNRLQPGESIKA